MCEDLCVCVCLAPQNVIDVDKENSPRNFIRVSDMFLITLKIVFLVIKAASRFFLFLFCLSVLGNSGDRAMQDAWRTPWKRSCPLKRHKRLILKYQEHHDYYFR